MDDLADDEVHGKYSKVITSRHGFNEALTAAAWEAYPSCENGLHRATSKARAVLEEYERIGRSTNAMIAPSASSGKRSRPQRAVRCLVDAAGSVATVETAGASPAAQSARNASWAFDPSRLQACWRAASSVRSP